MSHQDTAEAVVGFTSLGSIDNALHYTQRLKTHFGKRVSAYHLVAVPKYTMMYAQTEGHLISKRPTELAFWEIKGSQGRPFTTVNTAIRYVLNRGTRAQQPVIRKNADEALHILCA